MKDNKKNNYVIAQKPNLPLIVWFVSFVITKIPLLSYVHHLFDLISYGAIFTWAWLEIFQGVNNFRKGLGILVMVIILVTQLI